MCQIKFCTQNKRRKTHQNIASFLLFMHIKSDNTSLLSYIKMQVQTLKSAERAKQASNMRNTDTAGNRRISGVSENEIDLGCYRFILISNVNYLMSCFF